MESKNKIIWHHISPSFVFRRLEQKFYTSCKSLTLVVFFTISMRQCLGSAFSTLIRISLLISAPIVMELSLVRKKPSAIVPSARITYIRQKDREFLGSIFAAIKLGAIQTNISKRIQNFCIKCVHFHFLPHFDMFCH